MAKKTKIIVRNDPAKNRKTHCNQCGNDYDFDPIDPTNVYNDMHAFLMEQQHWTEHPSPTICWGMLEAVMDVIYEIAPSKKQADTLIIDVQSQYGKMRNKSKCK